MRISNFAIFGISLLLYFPFLASGQQTLIDSLNQEAYLRYRQQVEEGKDLAYRALSLAEEQQLSPQMVDSYINLSRCFRLEGQWDSAFQVLDLAISLGQEAQYSKGLMNAYNNLAICHLSLGDIEAAEPGFKQSLVFAQEIQDTKGQANAFNNLAIIAEANQVYDSAIFYLDGALAVYQQIPDSAGIARVYLNQAYLFDQQEQNDSAIHYTLKALRIQEGQGLAFQQATSHNQIGALYLEMNRQEDALPHYRTALSLFEEVGDIGGQATTNNNLGSALYQLEQYAEAESYLKNALTYAQQAQDSLSIGSSLVNLAGIYLDYQQDYARVKETLTEAIPYLEGTDAYTLPVAYDMLGRLYIHQEKRRKAIPWLEKALTTARYFENLDLQTGALERLATVYEELGQADQALEYYKQFKSTNDSLVNIGSLETIDRLNIEYESEKKEKENLKLQNSLTQAELVTAQQKAQRNQILGISALFLLIGLGGFIWFRYRQRIRIKEQEMALEQERARKEQEAKEAAKLRELDAMKTRFFTNISHEFRTPLTLILGQNAQMQSSVQDEGVQNRLEMVDRNGHRLLDLVNQVLDVAKLEAGGMDLEMTRQDAIPFLKHILYSFESMAVEQDISLGFESSLDHLETAFDAQKIERVVFNLLSNALKFTPAGGNIHMEVKQQGQQLHISIRDSGVGIKAEQLPYIFDRFFQAESSENHPQPGTGIGLSLVKELVELHQGSVEVESQESAGTTFRISLPIPEDLSGFPQAKPQHKLHPEALPSKSLAQSQEAMGEASAREQVLLVEDNPDVRSFIKEQLTGFGYLVHEAEDGLVGLEKAYEHIPDLIISDIMMPGLDGYGVAKALKEDIRTNHIPLILLTSKASDESRIAGLEQGADDYLLKPFNSKELEVRIRNLIEQRKRLRERFSSATIIRPNEVSAESMDQVFLKKVLENIETHLSDEQFGVERLSELVGMSAKHMNRKLGALINQTAGKLIRSMRLQRAADLIKQQAGNMSEIAYDTGFSSPAHFARSFKQQFGISPSAYQKQES